MPCLRSAKIPPKAKVLSGCLAFSPGLYIQWRSWFFLVAASRCVGKEEDMVQDYSGFTSSLNLNVIGVGDRLVVISCE